MLSPKMLGFEEDRGINVFEITPKEDESPPEFDPQEFLEKNRTKIKTLLDSSTLSLEDLANLKLLGFNTETPEIKQKIDGLVSTEFERNSIFDPSSQARLAISLGILRHGRAVSIRPSIEIEIDLAWAEQQFNSSNLSLHYLTKLVAAMGPNRIKEFENRHAISEELLGIMREWGDDIYSQLASINFLGAATALKEIFPEKLPEITEEQWDALKNILNTNDGSLPEIGMAVDMYILSSEKAEFTENGLVITPRKHLEFETQTQSIPQIRRF